MPSKRWINGSKIRIGFLGGTDGQHDMVRTVAMQWTEIASLDFEFTDDPNPQIRVAFDDADGAWSYVGTDNLAIAAGQPTLNLGWLDEGVILHEFGHMIGLSHEHQNPDGGIQWNEAQVIADLAGPPNYWDEATTRHNVLDKYSMDQILGTEFDPESIMLYAFPGDWTTNRPEGTEENSAISDLDREFVRGATMYPGRNDPKKEAEPLQVWTPKSAGIGSAGEEDLFSFAVTEPGMYVIETAGATDVVLALFGPDSMTSFVGEDDDGGTGRNARLAVTLQPGKYFAAVRHYDEDATGNYEIRVGRWPG